jgi:hypothetical protein
MISTRSAISNSDFFARMIEFGFLDATEQALPEDFTLVYELGRVLEDSLNPLTQSLAPVLWLTQNQEGRKHTKEKEIIPNLPSGEEYEANLIGSYRDVPRIYPHQFLLPDEVFMQKLVERSLWMPAPKAPRNYRYQSESDLFAPDSRKQKVYLLFDTSKSMQEMYRIHLAKAIAYFFLRQNRRELGTLFFRTFDAEIGPLRLVRDIAAFDLLISDLMCMPAEGRGTAMEKAILTAIQDIRLDSFMAEAEILIITDGAAHLDLEKIQPLLSDTISINCVKIGDASIKPDHKIIMNNLLTSDSEEARRIRQYQQKIKDLEMTLRATQAEGRKVTLQGELQHLQKQIGALTDKYAQKSMSQYGNEIQSLARIFIQIPDLNPSILFHVSPERISELTGLSTELLTILRDDPSAEDAKKAAVLYDHLQLLMQHNGIDHEPLKQNTAELQEILAKLVQQQAMNPQQQSHKLELSDNDHIQLSRLLKGGMQSASRIPLAKLLFILLRKLKRAIQSWNRARLLRKRRIERKKQHKQY